MGNVIRRSGYHTFDDPETGFVSMKEWPDGGKRQKPPEGGFCMDQSIKVSIEGKLAGLLRSNRRASLRSGGGRHRCGILRALTGEVVAVPEVLVEGAGKLGRTGSEGWTPAFEEEHCNQAALR